MYGGLEYLQFLYFGLLLTLKYQNNKIIMKKEFVTYEQALALKELGVGFPYIAWYLPNNPMLILHPAPMTTMDIPAPLKQQVFRWFREKYDWYLDLGHGERVDFYYAILKNSEPFEWRNDYSTYEEAENACIDKLIEIAKQQDHDRR